MKSSIFNRCVLFAAGIMVAGSVGCAGPCRVGRQEPVIYRPARIAGPHDPAVIFSPQIVVATAGSADVIEPPSMELFNWRPDWPAESGFRLGEVTFYQERYYDRQSSWGGWRWGPPAGNFSRTFRSYRTGVIVR